ncbi:MAG: HupE/UreJ family protein, partial [Pseudomonadota bacterium]
LLFVFCLMLLVPNLLALLKTITAFTLAHSLTLALAALQLVQVPQPPIEASIALSILFLARELSRRNSAAGTAIQRPWAVAFAFGLLHGFGFAGALSEVGLPQGDIPQALLLFNLGVEAGQLAFVLGAFPLLLLLRCLQRLSSRWLGALPVYAVGAVSGFWFLQRMVPIFGLRIF